MAMDNFARQAALAGGYYVADQTGGVTRSGVTRADDWVSVRDFGATGDGVTDDSTAIRNAMRALKTRAATNTGYQGGMSCLYFPEGVYRITTSNLLSSLNLGGVFRSGMFLKGAGSKNSVLWLDPAGASTNQRFYDNTDKVLWGMVCEDLCFAGGTDWRECDPANGAPNTYANISSFSKGFRFNGPGYESDFHFNRCEFRWLAQVVEYGGANNADTHIFNQCHVLKCIDVTYINNPQSLSITWTDCYLDQIFGDTLKLGANANGAGNFEMKGGAVIASNFTGKAAMSYVARIVDGGPGANAANFNFQNVRFELRGNFHGFANVSFGSPIVKATGSSFWNTGTADKNLVVVSGYASVIFDACAFHHGDGGGKLKFVIGGASDGTRGKNASLAFVNGCLIQADFVSVSAPVISWTGTGGRLTIDESCVSADGTAPSADPKVISYACDTFGPTSLTGEGLAVSLKHRTRRQFEVSPFWSQSNMAGSLGLTGTSVQIPPYCRVLSVWVKIEPGVGNANTVRCLIGNNDKSVVYASTTAAAQNAGHYVFANVHVPVGSTANLRRIRFWFDDGAGNASTASTAIRVDGGVVYTGQ